MFSTIDTTRTTYNSTCLKQYCWDWGVGIELGMVIHWAILMLGPGVDIELRRLLN